MIHHELWTEMSYSQCHWRAADVTTGLLLSLVDGGGLPAGRQADRQKDRADKPESLGGKTKTAEFGLIRLSADRRLLFPL